MQHKKYWKGFEELNEDSKFLQEKRNEFPEDLPILNELGNVVNENTATRRDFLKVLGFSVTAAAIAASCEIPVRRAIPYAIKPEELVPGIANFYASSFLSGNDYCSILVKTREGRPIKIEGNPLSEITQGATNARAQAAVVSLYDGSRSLSPKKDGEVADWKTIDGEIKQKLASASGSIAIISDSIASPTTLKAIDDFKVRFPNTKHVVFDAISYNSITTANEQMFGKSVIPSYDFSKADVIVGIGADFLGTWVSPVEFTKQYIKNRKIADKDEPKMSKHWQFEATMTITGGKADNRITVSPDEEGTVAVALLKALGGTGATVTLDPKLQETVSKVAADLSANKGKSLVVCGSKNANVQMVVNAINNLLGNYGNTIDLNRPYKLYQGNDKAMVDLVEEMNAGRVGAAILLSGANPAYNYRESEKFISGLKKVALTVSMSDRIDETAEHVTYLCPDNHFLESWGDAEVKEGCYSLTQPTIAPLFDTRPAQESLLRWSGNEAQYYDYLRSNWQQNIFPKQSLLNSFDSFWDKSLHDGIFEVNNPSKTAVGVIGGMYANRAIESGKQETKTETGTVNAVSIPASGDINAAVQAISQTAGNSGLKLVVYESVLMGDGRYANNPFLQETPDPISKVCWDNFVAVSKKMADEKGWKEHDMVEVKAGNYAVQLPIVFQPGQKADTISISLGYGRTRAGVPQCNVGKNAFPFVGFDGKHFTYTVSSGVSIEKVGGRYELPRTQTHHTIDDTGVGKNKRPLIRETNLLTYQKDKWAGNHISKKLKENQDEYFFTLYGKDNEYGPHTELYTRGLHWGLSIDLNTCVGCNACVTACNIENNIPIVGAQEVVRAHEMHWMRIDRYYSGDMENPDVTFMPMMCQHCDNAPCENVCPVAATNHSSEGINQMAYNRCIGTRYCANNCPYKVRRFNWYDYQGADSFYKNTIFDNDEHIMLEDLTRMVLNPDVTVRSRGVIEKCSFCVQRIQEGKLEAKKANRKLQDGEIKTACQQVCPADAIVFGDVNDPTTEVSILTANERSYRLLEELHVLPGVAYLTQIRNREAMDEENQSQVDKHQG
ncbi:MAG: TAT-variant-translocated molybdopterin oxidoreductase [Sphingobacteriales bacterium]|nr:MAG: TAT-variant-translocated molybdopterin oxidoreductase [Sphingobacteriales bacterium]